MNEKIKLAAYAVLLFLAVWFGRGFYTSYTSVTRASAEAATNDNPAAVTISNGGNTWAIPASTNGSNMGISIAPAGATNSTGQPIAQNGVDTSNVLAPPANPPVKTVTTPAHAMQGTMIAYLAAFVGAIIGLGLLIAHDVTQYAGNVAVDALFDDRGEGLRDPEYERAEQVWANGKHLDAIQLMRDFLKKNPREQYAALRIAEIYEKDLNNPLAAALEYEEVLKKKLPAERWGWAAVHLCNLYSKLGQQDKTRALLQRIVDEYPQTAAAKKARSRLDLPEPDPEPIAKDGTTEAPAESAKSASAAKEEPAAKSNLPPGFRPK